MKRYHLELERTKRAHQLHLRPAHSPDNPIDCSCEFQAGRFRKQKALGCGRARCLLCHFEKIFGVSKVGDRVRKQRFVDSLEGLLGRRVMRSHPFVAVQQSLAADGAIACFSSNFFPLARVLIARRS